ncbi:MAG: alpha/beta fold hydrolase [Acidimicrobiia bacterium]
MSTTLASETIGDGSLTVVFAHGFTQTRDAWRPVAQRLVTLVPQLRCVLVDLPGHGGSREVSADIGASAQMLTATGGRGIYVGYSLGARVVIEALVQSAAVHSAVAPAPLVSAAVVVSGTAGIEDSSQREARARSDDALAARIDAVGVEAFVREWLAQPLFHDLNDANSQVQQRITNLASGLADSLRRCSQGRQEPRWAQLAEVKVPVLAVAGARDEKYVAIARRIAATVPQGTLAIIPDTGHSAPLQSPGETAEHIADFIADSSAALR